VGGWKILRSCPACDDQEEIGLDDDRLSVCSGKSNRSTRSGGRGDGHTQRRGRSSSSSTQHVKKNPVETTITPRYDGEGYCCLHPSIRVAKKKTMGGWKLLVNVCPDCEAEGIGIMDSTSRRGRRRSMSRNRSNNSRSLSRGKTKTDDNNDDDDTRSVSSALSRLSARSSRSASKSTGGGGMLPRKVKNLKIRDQNRVPGRYSGYVDEKDRPDGR
jgi:hypothetical protein